MDIDFSSIDNLPNKVIENKVQKDSVKPSKKYMTQVKNKEKEEEWINKQYEYIKKSENLKLHKLHKIKLRFWRINLYCLEYQNKNVTRNSKVAKGLN